MGAENSTDSSKMREGSRRVSEASKELSGRHKVNLNKTRQRWCEWILVAPQHHFSGDGGISPACATVELAKFLYAAEFGLMTSGT